MDAGTLNIKILFGIPLKFSIYKTSIRPHDSSRVQRNMKYNTDDKRI